jgi:putative two-component system response regulator
MTQDAIPAGDLHSMRNSLIYYRKPRLFHKGLVETLARVLGVRDPELPVHSLRVANIATRIARRLGFPEEQLDLIRRGGLLHDIGKLGISQDILSKPGQLTPYQYETIRTHPVRGAVLLQECLECETLIPLVLHHHEFFNGQGYPDGIAGHRIEIEARIISVADAIDAMSSDRPYRSAFPRQRIISELQKGAGTQFDPLIAREGIQIVREIVTA